MDCLLGILASIARRVDVLRAIGRRSVLADRAALVLDVFVVHGHRFLDLEAESIIIVGPAITR